VSVTTVWSADSALHDPAAEVWIGIRIDGSETPERGAAFRRAAVAARSLIVEPTEHPISSITAVHDAGMISYLETAYDEWVKAGFPEYPGQDRVVAYAFRHPGAFGHVPNRFPASRAAMAGVYCMDTATVIGPGTYRGIRYAVDSSLTAADLVLGGVGCAYAAARPPGHHAGFDFFGGSCYLNNAAITAQHLAASGVRRVGIVDIDAHHGNGTQQIFYERSDVLYTSVHVDPAMGWFPHWSGLADETGSGAGSGFNHNFPLAPGTGDQVFLDAVRTACELVVDAGCEALVVSLGLDAGVGDPESPLTVSTGGFAGAGDMLATLDLPTVLVQEGGYDLAALEQDLTAFLTRFSNAGDPEP